MTEMEAALALAETAKAPAAVERTVPPSEDDEPIVPITAVSDGDLPVLPQVARRMYSDGTEIGRGTFGLVTEARDRRAGRPVALKELIKSTDAGRRRFEREARITARLQHPSIVPIYEIGRWENGEPFYAMKRVDGRALDVIIGERHSFGGRLELLPNMLAMADAVAYAHGRRIIHRDLKPSNVLIGPFGETVVVDWGLAKDFSVDDAGPEEERSAVADDAPQLTSHGAALGSPVYMAPELAHGQPANERTDVYALGATIYHALAGRIPYAEATGVDDALERVKAGPPRPLRELAPRVPVDLLAVVEKAMARDPAQRYPSAGELADDLRRFQTGQLVTAYRFSKRERVWRWLTRHRALVTTGGVLLTALLTVAAFSAWRIVRERDAARSSERARRLQTASAYIELSRNAQREWRTDEAYLWALAARESADTPLTRSHHADAAARLRPSLAWRHADREPCQTLTFSADGLLLCGGLTRLIGWQFGTPEPVEALRLDLAAINPTWNSQFDMPEMDAIITTSVDEARVFGVSALAAAGDRVAIGLGSQGFYLHDRRSGRTHPLAPVPERTDGDRAAALVFAPDGAQIWGGRTGGDIRRWQPAPDEVATQPRAVGKTARGGLEFLAIDAEGALIAAGCANACWVERFDATTLVSKQVREVGAVVAWTLTADRRRLVAQESSGRRVELRTTDLEELGARQAPFASLAHAALAHGGRAVAVTGARTVVFDEHDQGHDLAARAAEVVAISPDGRWVAAVDDDFELVAAPFDDPARELVVAANTDYVRAIAHRPDGKQVVMGGCGIYFKRICVGGEAVIYDTATGRRLGVLGHHQDRINVVRYSRDGTLLLTGGADGRLHLWNVRGAPVLLAGWVAKGAIVDAALRSDGHVIALVNDDGARAVMDEKAKPGQLLLHPIRPPDDELSPTHAGPGGLSVLEPFAGDADAWQIDAGFYDRIDASGRVVTSRSADHVHLQLRDVSERGLGTPRPLPPSVDDVAFASAGTGLVVHERPAETAEGAVPGRLCALDPVSLERRGCWYPPPEVELDDDNLAFSPDGRLAVGVATGDVLIFESGYRDPVARMESPVAMSERLRKPSAMGWSEDGIRLGLAYWNGTTSLWTLQRGQGGVLPPGPEPLAQVAIVGGQLHAAVSTEPMVMPQSVPGRMFVNVGDPHWRQAGGLYGNGLVIDLATGERNPTWAESIAVAAAPDDETLAVATADGALRIVTHGGERRLELGLAFRLAFSPDGHQLAVGGAERLTLVDPRFAEISRTFPDLHNVTALAFAPDGRLAVADAERILIYDLSTDDAKPARVVEPFGGPVTALRFVDDEQLLAATWTQGLLRMSARDDWRVTSVGRAEWSTVNDIVDVGRGRIAVSVQTDQRVGAIVLLDARTLAPSTELYCGGTDCGALAIDASGRWLAATSIEGGIAWWDVSVLDRDPKTIRSEIADAERASGRRLVGATLSMISPTTQFQEREP